MRVLPIRRLTVDLEDEGLAERRGQEPGVEDIAQEGFAQVGQQSRSATGGVDMGHCPEVGRSRGPD